MGLFDFLFGAKKARSSSVKSCPYSAPYVILDVETTGTHIGKDKIIQLSAIKYSQNGDPIDFYDTYINPGIPIPASATEINGITDRMVENAPTEYEVKGVFLSFIHNCLLVGYNVLFDLRFINKAFGNALDGRKYLDALPIARRFFDCPNYKLSTVAQTIGFSPDGSFHDSFTDCEAVAAVLCCIEDFPIDEYISVFSDSYDVNRAKKFSQSAISPRDIKPSVECVNCMHPFYQKIIVFTGDLSISRAEAAQKAIDVGAIVRTTVSRKTNYLVVGEQDISLVGDDGMSTKEESAYALNSAGKAEIKIIGEQEFFDLLEGTYEGDSDMENQIALSGFEEPYAKELELYNAILPQLQSAADDYGADAGSIDIRHGKNYSSIWFGSMLAFRICIRKNCYIEVPLESAGIVADLAPASEQKKMASGFLRVPLKEVPGNNEASAFVGLIKAAIDRKPKEWDCCHLYEQCSDAKRCVHPDKSFALACGYRKILNSGRIFYGKNRNI